MKTRDALLFLDVETPVQTTDYHRSESNYSRLARKPSTEYPLIPGELIISSIMADAGVSIKNITQETPINRDWITCTDARLIALPVRFNTHEFCLLTCFDILSRLKRDIELLLGTPIDQLKLPSRPPDPTEYYTSASAQKANVITLGTEKLFVSRRFDAGRFFNWLATNMLPNPTIWSVYTLIIVHDKKFKDFLDDSIEIRTRVAIDRNSNISPQPFHNEFLPTDTLLYTSVQFAELDSINDSSIQVSANLIMNSLDTIRVGAGKTWGQGIIGLRLLDRRNVRLDEHQNPALKHNGD